MVRAERGRSGWDEVRTMVEAGLEVVVGGQSVTGKQGASAGVGWVGGRPVGGAGRKVAEGRDWEGEAREGWWGVGRRGTLEVG